MPIICYFSHVEIFLAQAAVAIDAPTKTAQEAASSNGTIGPVR